MEDFPFFDQVGHDGGDFFNRNFRVLTVLIVDVDVVRLQALQRRVDGLADDLWTGIGNNGFVRRRRVQVEMNAELRADLDAIAEGLKRFAEERFVGMRIVRRAVDFGRIEEGVAKIDGLCEQFGHFFFISRFAVAVAHAHAAKADSRYGKVFS